MDLRLNSLSLYLDTGGASFVTQVECLQNDFRQIYKQRERWTVNVRIHPDQSATTPQQRQDSIVAKVAQIEAAVNLGSSNTIQLLRDDGSVADSITGAIALQKPSFGGDQPGENAQFRRCTMVFERELAGTTNTVSFSETVMYSGGGPRKVIQEIRNGAPQEYDVSQATAYHAVQVGQSLTRIAPYIRDPYWPSRIINPDAKSSGPGSPNVDGFPASWNYSFSSPAPFSFIIPQRP